MLRFRTFLRENEEKPKVVYHGSTGNVRVSHNFTVTHPSLKAPARVRVDHYPVKNKRLGADPKEASMFIGHSEHEGEFIGHLGHKHVRHVLGRLKHHLPKEIEHIESDGARVTGAKAKSGEMGAHVNISHVKPIPPEKDE